MKNKHLYQRYDGTINRFMDADTHYIDCETGNAFVKDDKMLLRKNI